METYLKLLCSLRAMRGDLKRMDVSAHGRSLDAPKRALLARELKWSEEMLREAGHQLAALPSVPAPSPPQVNERIG